MHAPYPEQWMRCDEAEPDEDLEPSLGSGAVGEHSDQSRWSQPMDWRAEIDAEAEHDGREPEEDFEQDGGDEREEDPAELGIADLDGMTEQSSNRYGRTCFGGHVEG